MSLAGPLMVKHIVHYWCRKLRRAAVDRESDEQLLHRFATCRDEVAFEALVRRHGPMVWGVCQRALFHHQDAEEAFQAAFLVLAKRRGTVAGRWWGGRGLLRGRWQRRGVEVASAGLGLALAADAVAAPLRAAAVARCASAYLGPGAAGAVPAGVRALADTTARE